MVISHDRRLLQRTDCAIWRCGDLKVAPLQLDFEGYEKTVLAQIAARVREEEERAAQRAAARRKKQDARRRAAAQQGTKGKQGRAGGKKP